MFDRRTLILSAAALATAAPLRAEEPLAIDALYGPEEDRTGPGPIFSDAARRFDGRPTLFTGFMAPPLLAETNFFLLCEVPMSVCPFCDTSSEWPNSLLSVFAKRRVDVVPFYQRIEVEGVLRLGEHLHEQTGFLSMARLEDAVFSIV